MRRSNNIVPILINQSSILSGGASPKNEAAITSFRESLDDFDCELFPPEITVSVGFAFDRGEAGVEEEDSLMCPANKRACSW